MKWFLLFASHKLMTANESLEITKLVASRSYESLLLTPIMNSKYVYSFYKNHFIKQSKQIFFNQNQTVSLQQLFLNEWICKKKNGKCYHVMTAFAPFWLIWITSINTIWMNENYVLNSKTKFMKHAYLFLMKQLKYYSEKFSS